MYLFKCHVDIDILFLLNRPCFDSSWLCCWSSQVYSKVGSDWGKKYVGSQENMMWFYGFQIFFLKTHSTVQLSTMHFILGRPNNIDIL